MTDAELMQGVERRVAALEASPDAAVRELARETLRAVLDLHREALLRVLTTLRERGGLGVALIDHLVKDPLVGSVLALHDLHPDALAERVREAIESVRPVLSLNGMTVRVEGLESGRVDITLVRAAGCPSTASRVRTTLEAALDRAAPDARGIVIREEAA
jgi:Fe-S cluster biogenesis protein NfuA